MPRFSRMVNPEQKTVYHVMSRTALDGFPFKDAEKDEFVNIIKRFSKIYFTDILGFCMMGNHAHILIRMYPGKYFSDDEIKERYARLYGDDVPFPVEDGFDGDGQNKGVLHYRKKWSSLSKFMQEIKQTFSRYYNKRHHRKGTLWGERFKSVIVENGNTLINCLAYIDLNPMRAGIVEKPEDYRWNSIGYHIQTNNKDGFLSTDFGPVKCASLSLRELHRAGLKEFNVKSEKERIRRYRRFLYEKAAKGDQIHEKTLNKELKREFKLSKINRFTQRTRYFTDSGIIGTREFVLKNYQQFKHLFQSKNEKIPKRIKGLVDVYSLKRLSEA